MWMFCSKGVKASTATFRAAAFDLNSPEATTITNHKIDF